WVATPAAGTGGRTTSGVDVPDEPPRPTSRPATSGSASGPVSPLGPGRAGDTAATGSAARPHAPPSTRPRYSGPARRRQSSQPPQLWYNHTAPHRGRLYHAQTEDSGVDKAHIFTHIFFDGTSISSKKVEYKDRLGEDDLDPIVIGLMQESHK